MWGINFFYNDQPNYMKKHILTLLILFGSVTDFVQAATTNTLTTGGIASALCRGSAVSVPYTASESFNAGNVFTAQISDANGSFASPVSIGTRTGTTSGIISATIPSGTATGVHYRIRVIASDPAITGDDNGSDIAINAPLSQPASILTVGGSVKVCPGDLKTYYVSRVADAISYNWSATNPGGTFLNHRNSATADSIDVLYDSTLTFSITMSVTASNSCGTSIARTLVIFKNTPATPGLISGPITGLCKDSMGVAYSVVATSGITYTWAFTTNVDATIHQDGSNNITVDFGHNWTSGTLGVLASNGTTCGLSLLRTLAIGSVPAQPAGISTLGGAVRVCPGDVKTYYVPKVSGVTSYTWTTTGAGGSMTNHRFSSLADSIDIIYDSALTFSFVLFVTADNGCGSSVPRSLVINKNTPSQPGVISGPVTEVCAGQTGVAYSVPYVGGIKYYWAFTTVVDAVINQDSGNIVTVDFGSNFTTGTLGVTAYNGTTCGPSILRTVSIASTPGLPGGVFTVGGTAKVCPGDFKTYYLLNFAGANSYSWSTTTPGGTIMNHRSGIGADTVDVLYDQNLGGAFVLTVVGVNACGNSFPRTLTVSTNIPTTPLNITGLSTEVCAGTNGVAYSVPQTSGITYDWFFTSTVDAVIHQNGGNTVTVDYGPAWGSGTLAVTADNGTTCPNSSARTLTITSKPGLPGNIGTVGGTAKVCPGDIKTYYIQKVVNANAYSWSTSSPGGTLQNHRSSSQADSINVKFDSSMAATFVLLVTADNSCGPSGARNITVVKKTLYYRDADGDGYGDPSVSINGCLATPGYVDNNTDCNDNNNNIHPGVDELCNGIDDNCNGQTDEGIRTVFYRDADGDGFGNPNMVSDSTCIVPNGYVNDQNDCNDNNANIHPGGVEVCNGIDDNCDSFIDAGVTTTFYRDFDSDGYGNLNNTIQACAASAGYVSDSSDCNDANNHIHPDADEVCNGFDDNCNGQVDEGVKSVFFLDADNDDYGDPSMQSEPTCAAGLGYVENNGDCDDHKAFVHPGATETCNLIDDDCDGDIDEGVTLAFFFDNDGDGFGDGNITVSACSAPQGYVSNNFDCDDQQILFADYDNDGYGAGPPAACGVTDNTDCNNFSSSVRPGANEVCNGYDDNCDGQVDEGVVHTYYRDADGDTYGSSIDSVQGCSAPAGYVLNNSDCDDSRILYADEDNDGYGSLNPSGCGLIDNSDCDDSRSYIYPGATEICNLLDDNCDGETDEGVKITFYLDADNDGYGDVDSTTLACTVPFGYAEDNTDCDDTNPDVNPGSQEICFNYLDDNCSGEEDEGCCPACTVKPATPSAITVSGGTAQVCPGNKRVYSVTRVFCVFYEWTPPAGATVIKGQGTSNATVLFNSGFTSSGSITVRAYNACGTSALRSLAISRKANPAAPGIITVSGGSAAVCPGDLRTYTVAQVTEVNYWWTPPVGGTLTSGQGTNSVKILYDTNFTANGILSVYADNGCGVSTSSRTLTISRNLPATPGSISLSGGSSAVCPGDVRTYKVTAVSGYTYVWTPPVGATVTAGQGTNIISLLFDTNFISSAPLTVSSVNNCGISAPRSLTISRSSVPRQPGLIAVSGGSAAVCPGDQRTYTISIVANTLYYNWVVKPGMNIISGQGTLSVKIGFDNSFVAPDTLTVTPVNGCGSGPPRILVIPRNNPATPSTITVTGGTAAVCPGDVRNYKVTAVAGITYNWVPPAGATVSGGQGTNQISLAFDAGFSANGVLTVTANNGCGTSAARTLTIIRNLPPTPGSVSVSGGSALVCPGDVRTYSVTQQTAVTYTWTPALGSSINSGQGSNSVVVTYENGFTANGILSVVSVNGCGNSSPRNVVVNRNVPATPGLIGISGGSAAVCPGDVRTYSVTAVSGITYGWTLPAGGNITSGAGTNSITVLYDENFVASGTLSVVAINTCATSAARTVTVLRNLPAQPGVITVSGGSASVCPGDARSYSVTAVSGMTYVWTTPTGGVISSGQGTNSITVTYNNNFTAQGTITVKAQNACGVSAIRSATVLYNLPGTPATLVGSTSVCKNTVNTYYTNTVFNASSYLWTVPVGAVIQGSSTDTMADVLFGTGGGAVSVRSVNGCGSSSARSVTVKITCREGETPDEAVNDLHTVVYPNPTSGDALLKFSCSSQTSFTMKVFDVTGRLLISKEGRCQEGLNNLPVNMKGYSKGIYMLYLQAGAAAQQVKLVIE